MSNMNSESESNVRESPHESSAAMNGRHIRGNRFGVYVPNRIFVGGIENETTETELTELFSRFGTVDSVNIINDRSGVPRGYGFVTFRTEDDAKRVIKDGDNLILKDKKLNVAAAVKKPLPPQSTHRLEPNHLLHPNVVYQSFPFASQPACYNDVGLYSPDGVSLYQVPLAISGPSPYGGSNGVSSYPLVYHGPGVYYAQHAYPSQLPPTQTQTQWGHTAQLRWPISQNPPLMPNTFLQVSTAVSPPLPQQIHPAVNSAISTPDSQHSVNTPPAFGVQQSPQLYAITGNNPQPVEHYVLNLPQIMASNNYLSDGGAENTTPELTNDVQWSKQGNVQQYQQKKGTPNYQQNNVRYQQPNNPMNYASRPVNNANVKERRVQNFNNYSSTVSSLSQSQKKSYGNGNRGNGANVPGANTGHGRANNAEGSGDGLNEQMYVHSGYNKMAHQIVVPNSVYPPQGGYKHYQQQLVTKVINGVPIYAMPNGSEGEVFKVISGALTPPLTPGYNAPYIHK